MVSPLTKIRKRDKKIYERPAEIEQAIAALLEKPRAEVRSLLSIRSRKDPDYVPSECLVHLIRATRSDNDQAYFDALYGELLRRIVRVLPKPEERSSDGKEATNAQREQVRDDVCDRFTAWLAADRREPGDTLDIFECRFDYAVAKARDGAWRRLGTDSSRRHSKTVEELSGGARQGGRDLAVHELRPRDAARGLAADLSAPLRRKAIELARRFEDEPGFSPTPGPVLKPGSSLIREWRGVRHEIRILEDGFNYKGEHLRSLSEAAQRITGTKWNGQVFFGLKDRKRSRASA
jgi:hypothetical protein